MVSRTHRTAATLAMLMLLTGCVGTGGEPTGDAGQVDQPSQTELPRPTFTMPPARDCSAPWVPVDMVTTGFSDTFAMLGMTVCGSADGTRVAIHNGTNHLWVLTTPGIEWTTTMRDPDLEERAYQAVSAMQAVGGIPIRIGVEVMLDVAPATVTLALDPAATAALEQYDAWVDDAVSEGVDLTSEILNTTDRRTLLLVGGCMGATYDVIDQIRKNRPEATPQELDAQLQAAYDLSTGAFDCADAYEEYRTAKATTAAKVVSLEAVEIKLRAPALTAAMADDLVHELPLWRLLRGLPRVPG